MKSDIEKRTIPKKVMKLITWSFWYRFPIWRTIRTIFWFKL